ncbi:hypothetical protein [Sinorhizobium fredii]|uniref:hypothetical protein n=1 Tax=Rhizobium fredii TaxID=380 RepID=UPI0011D22633|nr:hypothetical protein [Sinorhizobium fredii]
MNTLSVSKGSPLLGQLRPIMCNNRSAPPRDEGENSVSECNTCTSLIAFDRFPSPQKLLVTLQANECFAGKVIRIGITTVDEGIHQISSEESDTCGCLSQHRLSLLRPVRRHPGNSAGFGSGFQKPNIRVAKDAKFQAGCTRLGTPVKGSNGSADRFS